MNITEIPNEIDSIHLELTNLKEQIQKLLIQEKENPYERLTRKEVKAEYKLSYGTLHNMMRDGRLSYEKCGRKTLFVRTEVEKAMKGGRNA